MDTVEEAGARNSKADLTKLQTIHDHAVGMGATCASMDEARRVVPWIGDLTEALRQKDSHSARASAMYDAVRSKYAKKDGYPYPRDMFDKHVVVQHGDKMYQHNWSQGSDGSITLGDPSEVEATYTPITTTAQEESADQLDGDLVPLTESAIAADGTTRLKVIKPGWGTSGYYSADLLERDGPGALPAGTKMYLDHPTAAEAKARPERSVRDLAAETITEAAWDPKGPAGPGLYAEAKVFTPYQPFVAEYAKHIGVSIRALGKSILGEAEGRTGPIVERLSIGKSIDFVTSAGAGGQILTESGMNGGSLRELFEAAGGRTSGENMDQTKELREAQTQIARLSESLILRDADAFVTKTLGQPKYKNVPQITRDRLQESLAGQPVVKDGKLDTAAFATAIDEAVKVEVAYLAGVTGSGQVKNLGGAAPAEMSEADVEKELGSLFSETFGLSEAASKIAARGR